jgi:RNA polymerase sigma factor (sigma-70 family)
MASSPGPDLFRRAAQAVLASHAWSLLHESDLAAHAADLLTGVAAPTQTQAERACQQIYAQTLFAAAQDPVRQATAYREIHAYLYRIALHQRPHLAEDAAQEALLLIYQSIDTCRDPGAFLKFAIYQLMTAFHRLAPHRLEVSLDEPARTSAAGEPLVEILTRGGSLETEVEERALATDFLRWLRGVFEANPRARKQLLAVVLKYLEGQEDAQIAVALDTTIANVHVLRSRGLKKLRAEMDKLPPSARFSSAWHPEVRARHDHQSTRGTR